MSPKNQERLFPKRYASELLSIAEGDLQSAEILATAAKGRRENVFFHAHQSIEKSLKAVLCWRRIPVPLLHDLGILVALLPKDRPPPFGYELRELNDFAAVRRYEEEAVVLTRDEEQRVLEVARDVLRWATGETGSV